MTEHFTTEQCVDYARSVAGTMAAAMDEHLGQGCIACTDEVQLWRGVADLAAREAAYTPAAAAVRCAKALYSVFPPKRSGGLKFHLARLAFAAGLEPAFSGTRAAAAVCPHFLFRRADLMLDVQMEPRPEMDSISMAGQINGPTQPNRSFGYRPVVVLRGRDEVARAVTNKLGEFQIDFVPSDDLVLIVDLHCEIFLVSPLPMPGGELQIARG
jgi:hypothetical protein